MTAPIELTPAAVQAAPDAVIAGLSGKAIEGRSLGQIAWMRLRGDKAAIAGGITVLVLIVVALIGPFVVQNPTTLHSNLISPTFSRPYGRFGGVSLARPLGVDPTFGRDMLSRIVNGARWS